MLFSANIGFLWGNLPLSKRIEAAAKSGFDAVECHFPYDDDVSIVNEALLASKLPMVGLNTALGPKGCFGLAAITGEEQRARALIDQAIDYAVAINAQNINVVAGLTSGNASAQTTYCENLEYACERAATQSKTIVIEPLNPRAVPNYHISTVEQAIETILSVGADNIKIMFDFYHAQIVQGDLQRLITEHIQHIGHVQISAVHDRGEPDVGEINYPYLLAALSDAGYDGYVGAEYKPRGQSVESGLAWLSEFRSIL
jgi:hydroxypyruvate isomerase